MIWFVKSQEYDLSGLMKAQGVYWCWYKVWGDLEQAEKNKKAKEAVRAGQEIGWGEEVVPTWE